MSIVKPPRKRKTKQPEPQAEQAKDDFLAFNDSIDSLPLEGQLTKTRYNAIIRKDYFESLLKLKCTRKEVAGFFGVSEQAVIQFAKRNYKDETGNPMTFEEVSERFGAHANISLRRHLFKLAEKNAAVAIWLSKQYLGFTERTEQIVTGKDGRPLQIEQKVAAVPLTFEQLKEYAQIHNADVRKRLNLPDRSLENTPAKGNDRL